MEQYIEIKAANPDCLLFYRMGDFYELFFEDAEVASRALGIVLTKRGKHLGRDIPMCGVPVHPRRRIPAPPDRARPPRRGLRADRGPGRGEEARLEVRGAARRRAPGDAGHADRRHAARRPAQQLPARHRARARSSEPTTSRFALAWIDISTGEFRIAECDRAGLPAEIARLEPGEIIVSDALYADPELAPYLRTLPAVTPLTRDVFDGATAERRLAAIISRSPPPRRSARCRGWNSPPRRPASPMSSAPSSASGRRCRRRCARRRAPRSSIDQATRANLELVRTLGGERRGSLLAAIDRTVTAAGSRLLAQRLAAPLTEPAAIGAAARRGGDFRRRCHRPPADPRASAHRARHGAGAGAARGRPRRAARPRRHP